MKYSHKWIHAFSCNKCTCYHHLFIILHVYKMLQAVNVTVLWAQCAPSATQETSCYQHDVSEEFHIHILHVPVVSHSWPDHTQETNHSVFLSPIIHRLRLLFYQWKCIKVSMYSRPVTAAYFKDDIWTFRSFLSGNRTGQFLQNFKTFCHHFSGESSESFGRKSGPFTAVCQVT